MTTSPALASRLTIARNIRSLTQQELAAKSAVPQHQISRIERGEVAEPAFTTISKLAQALGVSLEALASPSADDLLRELAQDTGVEKGPLMGISLLTNTPTWARTLDNPEHLFICGEEGSGKAYAAKLEMLRVHASHEPVSIIDCTGEYVSLVERLGGTVFRPGDHWLRFNPLAPIYPGIALSQQVQWVVKWMKVLLHSAQWEDETREVVLQEALGSLYERRSLQGDGTLRSAGAPFLDELRMDLFNVERPAPVAAVKAAKELSKLLKPYASELTYSNLFNYENAPKSRLSVVDLSGVAPVNLRGALALLAMQRVLRDGMSAKKDGMEETRLLVFDCRAMPDGGSFYDCLQREVSAARRCGVALTIIADGIEGFDDAPKGKIVANCASSLILRPSRSHRHVLRHLFNLTEREQDVISSRGPGQGILLRRDAEGWLTLKGAATEAEEELLSGQGDVL